MIKLHVTCRTTDDLRNPDAYRIVGHPHRTVGPTNRCANRTAFRSVFGGSGRMVRLPSVIKMASGFSVPTAAINFSTIAMLVYCRSRRLEHGPLCQMLKAMTRGRLNSLAQETVAARWIPTMLVPSVHQPFPVATTRSGE